jgi:hypothetical protein
MPHNIEKQPTTVFAECGGIGDDDCFETKGRGIAVALSQEAFDAKTTSFDFKRWAPRVARLRTSYCTASLN